MERLIIYGAGKDYLKRRQLLNFEKAKGNVELVAMCSKDHFADYIDGMKVVSCQELVDFEFDWVIVFADSKLNEIKNELSQNGIDEKRVLDSRILLIPSFDFSRYISLLKNPVTLITDDCTAAVLYNYLKLPFTSPFILLHIKEKEHFLKVCNDPEYYLNQTLSLEREADYSRALPPIGRLGEGEKAVQVMLFHYMDFTDAKCAWERRLNRVNYDRLFCILPIYSEEDKHEFEKLKLRGKLGLTPNKELEGNKVIFLPRYSITVRKTCGRNGYSFQAYYREMENLFHGIDVLKILNYEEDYILER